MCIPYASVDAMMPCPSPPLSICMCCSDGIYREVWDRTSNKCIVRNVAVHIQALQPEQQSVADLLVNGPDPRYAKHTSTSSPSQSTNSADHDIDHVDEDA